MKRVCTSCGAPEARDGLHEAGDCLWNLKQERDDLRAQLEQERQRTSEAREVARECYGWYSDARPLQANELAGRHLWLMD